MENIVSIIQTLGFPIACVVGLAWYAKNTTDQIIALTEKVTNALVSSNTAITEIKEVLKELIGKDEK